MKKSILSVFSVWFFLCCFVQPAAKSQIYQPTYPSLHQHETPEWFRDAKLGIFIHWGVYSVPSWAERGQYAEWYPQRMQQSGSPTHVYHIEKYGEDFNYEDFIPLWKAELWDPDRWADLFSEAGAKYVVLTGEHHDGFPLWDSDLTEWNAARMGPKRDLVGELAQAVRARNMKFSPSYHGLLNYYEPGHFGPNPDYLSEEYVDFMHKKLKELIDRYQPDLLWLDGDWQQPPEVFRTPEIIAYYYNRAEEWGKEVAVNDRWGQVRGIMGDFYTQEYEYDLIDRLIEHKWENTRGMGRSFGYNKNEPKEDYMTVTELVHMLADNVSKNANLLLNVGPRADGTIPEIQKDRLRGLGAWLRVNGEAIHGTRPWVIPELVTEEGCEVRFTWKDETLYAILKQPENGGMVTLPRMVPLDEDMKITMPGRHGLLPWSSEDGALRIQLPAELPTNHASVLAITPEPAYLSTRSR